MVDAEQPQEQQEQQDPVDPISLVDKRIVVVRDTFPGTTRTHDDSPIALETRTDQCYLVARLLGNSGILSIRWRGTHHGQCVAVLDHEEVSAAEWFWQLTSRVSLAI